MTRKQNQSPPDAALPGDSRRPSRPGLLVAIVLYVAGLATLAALGLAGGAP